MFTIQLHYSNGDTDQENAYTLLGARKRARRIAAVFARAAARGDIDDHEIPWIWIVDATGNETRH